jgi:hypothetical protein
MIPVAVSAECTLITLVEAVPILVKRSSRYRRIAKIAVPVNIRTPPSRCVMTACLESIVKASLAKTFMGWRIRCGII